MSTPNPRGFPTQSMERMLQEIIPSPPSDHWSFDSEADKRQKQANACLEKLRQAVEKMTKGGK